MLCFCFFIYYDVYLSPINIAFNYIVDLVNEDANLILFINRIVSFIKDSVDLFSSLVFSFSVKCCRRKTPTSFTSMFDDLEHRRSNLRRLHFRSGIVDVDDNRTEIFSSTIILAAGSSKSLMLSSSSFSMNTVFIVASVECEKRLLCSCFVREDDPFKLMFNKPCPKTFRVCICSSCICCCSNLYLCVFYFMWLVKRK